MKGRRMMEKILKKWNERLGLAPAAVAVIVVMVVYMIVRWDMPNVDFDEFLRMPVYELEVTQLFLLVFAASVLGRFTKRKE